MNGLAMPKIAGGVPGLSAVRSVGEKKRMVVIVVVIIHVVNKAIIVVRVIIIFIVLGLALLRHVLAKSADIGRPQRPSFTPIVDALSLRKS